jgi:serine/threonine protein kinase
MISERVIWIYFLQLAHALQHIHSKRMMHRDIKVRGGLLALRLCMPGLAPSVAVQPQNVFLDADGNVKIGDFGLGRMFGPQVCWDRWFAASVSHDHVSSRVLGGARAPVYLCGIHGWHAAVLLT